MLLNVNKYILGRYQIIHLENGVSIALNVCFGKNEDFWRKQYIFKTALKKHIILELNFFIEIASKGVKDDFDTKFVEQNTYFIVQRDILF